MKDRLRPQAEIDLVERSRYYLAAAGQEVAAQFFDSAIDALHAIADMPAVGSPRIGELVGIPVLRTRRIPSFPCGWYSLTPTDHIDVVRLLADRQEVTAALEETDD